MEGDRIVTLGLKETAANGIEQERHAFRLCLTKPGCAVKHQSSFPVKGYGQGLSWQRKVRRKHP